MVLSTNSTICQSKEEMLLGPEAASRICLFDMDVNMRSGMYKDPSTGLLYRQLVWFQLLQLIDKEYMRSAEARSFRFL
jgi:hypothetical protein